MVRKAFRRRTDRRAATPDARIHSISTGVSDRPTRTQRFLAAQPTLVRCAPGISFSRLSPVLPSPPHLIPPAPPAKQKERKKHRAGLPNFVCALRKCEKTSILCSYTRIFLNIFCSILQKFVTLQRKKDRTFTKVAFRNHYFVFLIYRYYVAGKSRKHCRSHLERHF